MDRVVGAMVIINRRNTRDEFTRLTEEYLRKLNGVFFFFEESDVKIRNYCIIKQIIGL